jgi:Domain of unknown function (DUF222)
VSRLSGDAESRSRRRCYDPGVVTTTLNELEAAAGKALTGGGSLVPMSDVICMASHARHYLGIFDKGNAIGLYHTKRFASPGQRIVLYANEGTSCAP